ASASASISRAIIAAPSSSTISSVPTTWCKCVMQNRKRPRSAGFSTKPSSASRACLSVSSISLFTHPRVLGSTFLYVLMGTLVPDASCRAVWAILARVYHRFGGLARTDRRHARRLLDLGHARGYHRRRFVLTVRVTRHAYNQVRKLFGHRFDFAERLTGGVSKLRRLHHAVGGLLHRGDRFVGIRLNGFDELGDLLRRFGGTFGEALHVVRDHREAAARFTRHRRLNSGIERED